MADFNLEVALKNENLTQSEWDYIRDSNSRNAITTEDDFRKILEAARRECSIMTSKKELVKDDALQCDITDIRSAWKFLENADKGNDEELKTARAAMLAQSEEAMQLAAKHIEAGDLSDDAAIKMQEWLAINNAHSQNAKRNKKIASALKAQLDNFDKTYGMESLSAKDAARIQQIQQSLENTRGINPLEKKEGTLIYPIFKNISLFYDNLRITENGESLSPENQAKYISNMIEIARYEAITQISFDPNFLKLSDEEKKRQFFETWNRQLEQGAASLIIGQETVEIGEKFDKNKLPKYLNTKDVANTLSQKFQQYLVDNKPLEISTDVVNGVAAARFKEYENINARLAQKTGKFGFFNKVKSRIKKFKENHPKIAATMKILGTIGLTIGVSMVGGAAGMAALGAYRTAKALYKARKECGSWKKVITNPKHMITIGSNLASTIIAGYGVMELGSAANGMLGNLGVGGTYDAIKTMASDAVNGTWNAITHPIDSASSLAKGVWHGAKWTYNHLADGNIGDTAGKTGNFLTNSWYSLIHPSATVDAAAAAGNETARVIATQRAGRLFVGLSAAVGNAGAGLHEVMTDQKYKGKRFKATLKVLGKAFVGAATAVVGYEIGTHYANASLNDSAGNGQDIAHTGGKGGQIYDGNYVETPEAQRFNQIFQGENEQNLEKACNRAPSVVIKDLQNEGILPKDYKLTSSHKLLNDIRGIYAHNPEANPQELSDYVNSNQKRFLDAMNADNARKIASASKDIMEDQIGSLDNAEGGNFKVVNKDLTNQAPAENNQSEVSQPKTTLPSHEEMLKLNERIKDAYHNQEKHNFGKAIQTGIKDAINNDELNKGHAALAAQIESDSFIGNHQNAERTFNDVRKSALEMMQEENLKAAEAAKAAAEAQTAKEAAMLDKMRALDPSSNENISEMKEFAYTTEKGNENNLENDEVNGGTKAKNTKMEVAADEIKNTATIKNPTEQPMIKIEEKSAELKVKPVNATAEPQVVEEEKKATAEPQVVEGEKKATAEPHVVEEEKKATAEAQVAEEEKKATAEPQVVEEEKKATAEPQVVEGEKKATAEPHVVEEEKKATAEEARKAVAETQTIKSNFTYEPSKEQIEDIKAGNFKNSYPTLSERHASLSNTPKVGETMGKMANTLLNDKDKDVVAALSAAGVSKDDPFAIYYAKLGEQLCKFNDEQLRMFASHYGDKLAVGNFSNDYIQVENAAFYSAQEETIKQLDMLRVQMQVTEGMSKNGGNVSETQKLINETMNRLKPNGANAGSISQNTTFNASANQYAASTRGTNR